MPSTKLVTIIISLWTTKNSISSTSAHPLSDPIRLLDVAIRENTEDLSKCTHLEAKSFVELVRKSNLFVDTSIFVKEALAIINQLNVLVIPPNFGRSINLDMYREFLHLPLDVTGTPIVDSRNHSTYRFFKFGEIDLDDGRRAKLRKPLQISKYDDLFEKYQGKFPVVYVDFSKLKANNTTHMEQQMWSAIRRTYRSHSYLVPFLGQNPRESYALEQFIRILEGNQTNVTLAETLLFLSQQLVKKFPNRKVVVLIDDEDVPINSLRHHYTITKREVGKLHSLMDAFLKTTFINNPHLHHGLVTGSTDHVKGCFTNYEKFRSRNIVAKYDPVSHYFGLTNDTLALLAAEFNVSIPPWSVDELLKSNPPEDFWYQGEAWMDDKHDVVHVQFDVALQYMMNQYAKMRKSAKIF